MDAGCNTGVTGWRLFQKGFLGRYYGVDSNWKALLLAEGNMAGHNAVFKQDDLAKLSFPDQYADIVFSKDVIEHCLGYDDILKDLCRVMKTYFIFW